MRRIEFLLSSGHMSNLLAHMRVTRALAIDKSPSLADYFCWRSTSVVSGNSYNKRLRTADTQKLRPRRLEMENEYACSRIQMVCCNASHWRMADNFRTEPGKKFTFGGQMVDGQAVRLKAPGRTGRYRNAILTNKFRSAANVKFIIAWWRVQAAVATRRAPSWPENVKRVDLITNFWADHGINWNLCNGVRLQPQQSINRVDPTISWVDLITHVRTMSTRKSKFRGRTPWSTLKDKNKLHLATKISSTQGWRFCDVILLSLFVFS